MRRLSVGVAVVNVGVMRMPVHQPLMEVLVHVRLAWRVAGPVLVLVVLVVHVPVGMPHRLVHMLVLVALGEVQPQAQGHRDRGGQEASVDRLPEEEEANSGSHERRQREVRTGARGAQGAHREHVEHQADAIPDQAHNKSTGDPRSRQQGAPKDEPKGQVHCAGDQPFHAGDLDWIARRNLLGQVVVHRPAEAGSADEEWTDPARGSHLAWPRKKDPACHNRRHPDEDPMVDILPEDDPGEQGGKHALQVQQPWRPVFARARP